MTRWCLGALAGLLLGAAPAPAQSAASPTADAINEMIAAKWKEAGIKQPAKRAPDLEFLRRAFIDLLGRTATVEEVSDFEQDQSGGKRTRLIKRLLYSEKYVPKFNGSPATVLVNGEKKPLSFNYKAEYADHWANIWTVWLMTRTGHQQYRDSMNEWLKMQLEENISYKDFVTQLLTASGKTNGNPAVNFIVQHLGDAVPRERQGELGRFDAVPITSRVTRLFLGLQTQCTQCHDHPFNKEWVQSDYWGVNAFFRQTVRDLNPTPGSNANGQRMANAVHVTLSDDTGFNPDGKIFYERRDGKLMAAKPNFLKDYAQAEAGESATKTLQTASAAGYTGKGGRREVLAHYVTRHDNFGRAYVNRIWGHLFGRGLNKEASVDDFGSNNEVVHPELMERLAEDFRKYEYDPKQLLEWICTSDVYGLSHEAVPAYADAKFDPYFARMPLKSMSPEVLHESIMTATKAERGADKAERKAARERFLAQLVRNFGDDEGNEMTFNGTVIQALILMNGRELNDEVSKRGNNAVNQLVIKYTEKGKNPPPNKILDELFVMTLNRHATPTELATLLDFMSGKRKVTLEVAKPEPANPKRPAKDGPGTTKVTAKLAGTNAADIDFYQDVFWALLNTNEFILNH